MIDQSYHSMNVITEYPNTATLRIDKGVAHRESLSRALVLFSWWFYQRFSSRSLSLTLNTCHSNTVDFIIFYIYKEECLFVCLSVCSLCIPTPLDRMQRNFSQMISIARGGSTSTLFAKKRILRMLQAICETDQ